MPIDDFIIAIYCLIEDELQKNDPYRVTLRPGLSNLLCHND